MVNDTGANTDPGQLRVNVDWALMVGVMYPEVAGPENVSFTPGPVSVHGVPPVAGFGLWLPVLQSMRTGLPCGTGLRAGVSEGPAGCVLSSRLFESLIWPLFPHAMV